jgi:hypothetical protein
LEKPSDQEPGASCASDDEDRLVSHVELADALAGTLITDGPTTDGVDRSPSVASIRDVRPTYSDRMSLWTGF